jgi:hypothetical protein
VRVVSFKEFATRFDAEAARGAVRGAPERPPTVARGDALLKYKRWRSQEPAEAHRGGFFFFFFSRRSVVFRSVEVLGKFEKSFSESNWEVNQIGEGSSYM